MHCASVPRDPSATDGCRLYWPSHVCRRVHSLQYTGLAECCHGGGRRGATLAPLRDLRHCCSPRRQKSKSESGCTEPHPLEDIGSSMEFAEILICTSLRITMPLQCPRYSYRSSLQEVADIAAQSHPVLFTRSWNSPASCACQRTSQPPTNSPFTYS